MSKDEPISLPSRIERFRIIALSLPASTEQDHFGRPSFRVGGRIFATLWLTDSLGMLKLTPAQQRDWINELSTALRRVDGTWGRQGATLVRLTGRDAVTQASLRMMLTTAWVNAAPASLRKEWPDLKIQRPRSDSRSRKP